MLTGRHVLICFVVFFAVVIGVNGILAYYAVTTFDGADVANAYVSGRSYDRELAAAEAQKERGWQVALSHRMGGEDELNLRMKAMDAAGHSIGGLRVEAQFKRPTLASLDFQTSLPEIETGLYQDSVKLPQKGQWILEVSAYRDDVRVYRTLNRVIVK